MSLDPKTLPCYVDLINKANMVKDYQSVWLALRLRITALTMFAST